MPGEITRIAPADPALKVPHMGWNDLVIDRAHPVTEGIAAGDHAYFVHSWQMEVADPADLVAHVDYGGPVTAIVARGTVVGTQFHPEKKPVRGAAADREFPRLAALTGAGPPAREPETRGVRPSRGDADLRQQRLNQRRQAVVEGDAIPSWTGEPVGGDSR